ncbi:MAG: ATP-binding cassette, subfamily bacterial [Actinomycetota bacterium]|jgi:ATP-binding cassette subfamily B protein|nr:ATP-binding cassette, subfamily bacterial [Actinomycetota bacterium]
MKDALVSCLAMFRIAWRHDRGKLTFSTVATLASGASWPLLALAMKGATDAALAHDVGAAILYGVFIGAGAIGVLMLQHFAYLPYTEIAERAQITLEAELMTLANGSARLDHHERPDYADKFELLRKEIGEIAPGFTGLFNTLGLLVSMSVTAVLLADVSPWLLLLPIAAIPPVLTGQRSQRMLEKSREKSASTTRRAWHLFHLATRAAPAKELRVFRLQREVRRRQRVLWDEAGSILWSAEKRAALVVASGQLVFAIAYVVAVLLVVRQAAAGASRIGDVVLVMTLAAQVNQQVSTGLQLLQQLQRMTQSLTRLRWMRTLIKSQEPPVSDTTMPERISHGIELRGLGFAYPGTDKPVMSEVDLLLPAGTTIAVVGENGAGKTTLIKLLCRFYEATEGEVTLDGVDIQRFPLDEWRRRIAVGFQDFVCFELPAQHTVGVGDLPSLDDEAAVLAALERAHADDIVGKLQDGLRTQLGKSYTDGAELSGGQWQKMALGRAMMREFPLLLILDEPTSALDAEAEHSLFERYAANAQRVSRETGAITVLVSHRFSTVRMADLILVMDGGRLVEAGDHAQLMAHNGSYAQLYSLQAAAYH